MENDWRQEYKNLYNRVLKILYANNFHIYDGETLEARKIYKTKKNIFEIIYVFPEKFPFSDIRANLNSPSIFQIYLKRPIKHLTIIGENLLNLCLRGAWNNLDFTNILIVEKETLRWIKEYEDNESFPDDFDLPENTLFFPLNEINFAIYTPTEVYTWDIFKEGSSGIFEFALSTSKNVALIVGLYSWTSGSGLSKKIEFEINNKEMILYNLFFQRGVNFYRGVWQFANIPPSPLAIRNNQLNIPEELNKYYWVEEIVKKKDVYSVMPDGRLAYLFFYELFGKKDSILVLPKIQSKINESLKTMTYIKPHVLSDENLFSRSGNLLDFDSLVQKQVACIGLGAIGSQAALQLARLGLRHFSFIDSESLSIENIVRHACDLEDVNLHKTVAVAKKIGKINPNASFNIFNQNVLEADLKKINPDLFISAIANDQTERYLNKIFIKLNKPAIYARTTTTSYAGRIFRVIPNEDACLECLTKYHYFKDIRYVSLTDEKLSGKELITFKGCIAPSYIGVNLDISNYANFLARMAFDTLKIGRQKYYAQFNANHLIFATRLVKEEPKIKDPFILNKTYFGPLAGCSICGAPKVPFSAIVISENVIKKIKELGFCSKKIETGGVLVGTILDYEDMLANSKVLFVTHCTGPGPKAKRLATYFDRDVHYCNKLVALYCKMTKGTLNYVGEWHTHPSFSVSPSNLDDKSLYRITKEMGYKLGTPLSIIQSNISENISFTVYSQKSKYADNPIITDIISLNSHLGIKVPKDIEKL